MIRNDPAADDLGPSAIMNGWLSHRQGRAPTLTCVPDDPENTDDTALDAGSVGDPVTGSEQDRPSYEQARAELAVVVERLETGGATLEESLVLWERGEQLATICQDWLDGARARLTAAAKLDRPAARDE
jgi:exodeoxyribonuclease VII small subunit